MRKLQVLYLALLFLCAISFQTLACSSHYQRYNIEGCYENITQVFNHFEHTGVLKSIVLDPGHGGRDHGCSGSSSKEKHLALEMALKLGKLINQDFPEIEVIYTRKSDIFVPLQERIDIANSNKADLFISIHCNSLSVSSVRGSETYVLGLDRSEENLDFIRRENRDFGQGPSNNSPLSYILGSNHQNAYLSHSIAFAEKVESQLNTNGHSRSLGVKQAGFVVLRQASMPSVLIETGFLSNPEDEKLLKSERGQYSIVQCILSAIAEYKNEYRYTFANYSTSSNKVNPKKTFYQKPEIEYYVQIAASSSLNTIDEINELQELGPLITRKENGWFKYMIGHFDSKESAEKIKEKLAKSKYASAFIVAYHNGERVNL